MTTEATTTTRSAQDFSSAWQQWQVSRWSTAAAPHGTASLDETAWLFDEPQHVLDLAGRWSAEGDVIVGTGLGGSGYTDSSGAPIADSIRLSAGHTVTAGDRLLRAIARGGSPALRVFDPASHNRTTLDGIDAYAPEEKWSVRAHYTPNVDPLEIESVDGYRSLAEKTGTLSFTLDGTPHTLTATEGADALSIVFADATNGVQTYRFRFLDTALPDADGVTVIDFTRAYLPPCAFSPHYVCPLPPAGNRFDIAVTAGEKNALRH